MNKKKTAKMEKKKDLGVVFFDYPFNGHFFMEIDRDFMDKTDEERSCNCHPFRFRTHIMHENIKMIEEMGMVIGSMSVHGHEDFIVEAVEKMKESDFKDKYPNATWGEYWILGS